MEHDWFGVSAEDERLRTITFNDIPATWTFRKFIPLGVSQKAQRRNAQIKADDVSEDANEQREALERFVALGATVEWSYGALNEQTLLNDVPPHHYILVHGMLMEMYLPLASRMADASRRTSSSPSTVNGQFPTSSSTPISSTKPDGRPAS